MTASHLFTPFTSLPFSTAERNLIESRDDIDFWEVFLRDENDYLLGFVKFNVDKKRNVVYVIETTTSHGFKYFDEDMKQKYKKNGYHPSVAPKGFGVELYRYMLDFIKKTYPSQIDMALICAETKDSEDAIWKLLDRVQKEVSDTVKGISGGNEMHVATIYLR